MLLGSQGDQSFSRLSPSAAQVEAAFNVCSGDTATQRMFLKLLESDASYKPSVIKVFQNIDLEDVSTIVKEFVRKMHQVEHEPPTARRFLNDDDDDSFDDEEEVMVGGTRVASMQVTELKKELTKRMPKGGCPAKWPRKAELVKMLEQIIRESDLEACSNDEYDEENDDENEGEADATMEIVEFHDDPEDDDHLLAPGDGVSDVDSLVPPPLTASSGDAEDAVGVPAWLADDAANNFQRLGDALHTATQSEEFTDRLRRALECIGIEETRCVVLTYPTMSTTDYARIAITLPLLLLIPPLMLMMYFSLVFCVPSQVLEHSEAHRHHRGEAVRSYRVC
jgi:hypothetical protein